MLRRMGLATLLSLMVANACPAQKGGGVDIDRSILSQIKDAYRSVYEVPGDLRDELRSYYKNPTPQREEDILKEVRRLYLPSEQQEQAILYEVRKAYERWSPEQEARIYRAIEKAPKLPEGAVPPSSQARHVIKIFTRLDADEDGFLSPPEMPDALRKEGARWDADEDGAISPREYAAFYTKRLSYLSEQVATGKIDLGLKRGGPDVTKVIQQAAEAGPLVFRAGKLPVGLPGWFFELDTDKDGQVALYEWRTAGRPLDDFALLDTNHDGFATAEEVLQYVLRINQAKMETKR